MPARKVLHFTLLFLTTVVWAVMENEELACNDDLTEALGVKDRDHLLYGLTADCELFFASNPPPGTNLSAVFGPKAHYASDVGAGARKGNYKYEMLRCHRAVMAPIKDANGKLKLLVIGPIHYDTRSNVESSNFEWFAYFYDFKKPRGGSEWYVKEKLIECAERDRLAALAKNETQQLRWWSMMPLGIDCQYDDDINAKDADNWMRGQALARSFLPNDSTLFFAFKSNKILDELLTWEDRIMYVKEYKINSTTGYLSDGSHEMWRSIRDWEYDPRGKWAFWKLIKKPWDTFAFGSDLLEVRLDQGAQKLFLIGDEGMKVVDFTPETLQNKNLFYASQGGGVLFDKTGIRNTSKVAVGENWRVRQRQIVNERMIIHYDRFEIFAAEDRWEYNQHRRNFSSEIVVLPMGKEMAPEEFGKGAKCVGRLVQPSGEMEAALNERAKTDRRTEAANSRQDNFQVNLLDQKLYDFLYKAT